MTDTTKKATGKPVEATMSETAPGDGYVGVRVLKASHTRLMSLQALLTQRTGLRQTMSQALEFALNCAEEKEKEHVLPDVP